MKGSEPQTGRKDQSSCTKQSPSLIKPVETEDPFSSVLQYIVTAGLVAFGQDVPLRSRAKYTGIKRFLSGSKGVSSENDVKAEQRKWAVNSRN